MALADNAIRGIGSFGCLWQSQTLPGEDELTFCSNITFQETSSGHCWHRGVLIGFALDPCGYAGKIVQTNTAEQGHYRNGL